MHANGYYRSDQPWKVQRSRTNSSVSNNGSTSDSTAALQGASAAFIRAPLKPAALRQTYTGTNGALAAASKAGSSSVNRVNLEKNGVPNPMAGAVGRKSGEMLPRQAPTTPRKDVNTSRPQSPAIKERIRLFEDTSSAPVLTVPSIDRPVLSRSPSHSPSSIAAQLAAARSPSVSGKSSSTLSPRRILATQVETRERGEEHGSGTDTDVFDTSLHISPSSARTSVIESPKPVRPVSGGVPFGSASVAAQLRSRSRTPSMASKPADAGSAKSNNHPPQHHALSAAKSATPMPPFKSPPAKASLRDGSPVPPSERSRAQTVDELSLDGQCVQRSSVRRASGYFQKATETDFASDGDTMTLFPSEEQSIQTEAPEPYSRPAMPATHRSLSSNVDLARDSAAQLRLKRLNSSSSNVSHSTVSPLRSPPSDVQKRPSPSAGQRRRQSQISDYCESVDSLANAIVASSLASSRAPSPTKFPPPVPPARRGKAHSFFHRHNTDDSRTPSPSKGMRTTLRDKSKDESEGDSRKGRKHLMRKHPNKHHEGDRKRWRDEITERERKRYEGVWAANRGFCVPSSIAEFERAKTPVEIMKSEIGQMVSNLIVKDIWSRSRLPAVVLEEVWDLVDSQSIGLLTRDEFVVGLWLVDQSLKGRKLPSRVSESVWASVRRLQGIKIPKYKR